MLPALPVVMTIDRLPRRGDQNFDPYKVLGLRKGATNKEISEAYRALSEKYNPNTPEVQVAAANGHTNRAIKSYVEKLKSNHKAIDEAFEQLGRPPNT